MVPGTMMDDYPLTLDRVFEQAGRLFSENDIVSKLADGTIHHRAGRKPVESAPTDPFSRLNDM